MKAQKSADAGKIWGPADFRAFIDRSARSLLGMGFDEFARKYRENPGSMSHRSVHDLGGLLQFAEMPDGDAQQSDGLKCTRQP